MSDGDASSVLLVGAVAGPKGAVRLAFARLDAEALRRIAPLQVVCALFAAEGDALAVAERLAECGWHGRLTVLAPGLPNRRMVEAELQSAATGIAVEVIAGH